MNKVLKLGFICMSAILLVACGESDTVDKENLPVDLGEVDGYEESEMVDSEVLESKEVTSEESPEEYEARVEEGWDVIHSEAEQEEKDIEAANDDNTDLLPLGESNTVNGVTFTVTDSKYIDAPSNSAEDVVKVLQISFKAENNSDYPYLYGSDFDLYVNGYLTPTNVTLGSSGGTLQIGNSIAGNLYYDITGDGTPEYAVFNWNPISALSDEDENWNRGDWDVFPK